MIKANPAFRVEEIDRLKELFKAARVGDVVSFKQMDAAVGRPLKTHRYIIHKAMTLATKETGALYESVRGVGYERKHGSRAQDLGKKTRQRVRRMTRRSSKIMGIALALTNDIDEKDRLAAYAEQASLGLLNHLARDRVVVQLADVVREKPPSLASAAKAAVEALKKQRAKKVA